MVELLTERFEYRDGGLYYKKVVGSKGRPGEKAGYLNTIGYWVIMIDGKAHLEHRLIYLMHHGTLPRLIDHVDRNRSNNRIENLRPATKSQNQVNMNAPITNTSGIKCVRLDPRRGKWYAEVKRNGTKVFLGYHPDAETAHAAFLNYSKEHDGQFANEE